MLFNNRLARLGQFSLILALMGGMLGAVPLQASVQTVRNPFSSLITSTKKE
jgi:hypothetical protein